MKPNSFFINLPFRMFYFVRALISMLLFIVICFISCISEDDMSKIKYVPMNVQSTYGILITTTTATVSGTILASLTSQNRINVTRGVCWSTQPNPTTANFYKSEKGGMGSFTLTIDGLQPETKYYYRAYVSNNEVIVYGNEGYFTTKAISIPTLSTNAVTSVSVQSATCGGTIVDDGGKSITACGVCWSITSNPTIDNNKTLDGTGKGSFINSITGLTPGTTYYVRAYATNSIGTAYGNENSFTTFKVMDIDGNAYTYVTIGTQTWMVENLKTTKYNDGTPIPLYPVSNLTTDAYYLYNNDAVNKNTYGLLYNWYAVITGKLAPTGWHVATDAEWTTLENYVSANLGVSGSIAKALAAKTNWGSLSNGTIGDNSTLNNSSGFTALPGGSRTDGGQSGIGEYGNWWCSGDNGTTTFGRMLYNYYSGLSAGQGEWGKRYFYSVRCVRDN